MNVSTPNIHRRQGCRALLLKALAAGALVFSLAGCIPIPVMDISPTSAEVGEEVTFDGSGTIVSNIPEDTVAVSYKWTFGDGNTGSGASTTHTYDAVGTYEVTLKVIDSAGRVGEATETVTVSEATATTDSSDTTDTSTSTDTTSEETTSTTTE